MEQVTHPGSGVGVGEERPSEVKVHGNVQEILINGDGNPQEQEGNKQENGIPHSANDNIDNSSKDLFEAQDKTKVLELQLQTINEELQNINQLQEELKVVNHRLEESTQAVETLAGETLATTKTELAESLEKLYVTKSHFGDLEQELSSKEAYNGKLSQELDLYKNFEDQMKQEKMGFENTLSFLNEEPQAKTVVIEEIKLKLEQEIKTRETAENRLPNQLLQKAINAEKEDASVQLQSSSKAIEDLSQQLVSEREELQSQISSVLDENNRTNIMYQDAKEEIEELEVQIQEMQNIHKTTESSLNSDLENLNAELSQKSQLQALISELEQQLSAADTKHKEEVSSILDESNRIKKMYQDAKEEIEAVKIKFQEMQNVYKTTEFSLNANLENLKEELSQKSQLQVVISELEKKLSAADAKHKEEVDDGITEDNLIGVESKSRDLELSAKLPSKRKNRKKSGELIGEKASPSSSGGSSIIENSGINSLKFFSGVVVLSLFIGVYLMKRS